jgi:hypothetical protein
MKTKNKILMIVVFCFFSIGCNEEKEKNYPGGMWKVKAVSISGELTDIGSPPENASYPDISIVIPEETQGSTEGHTFYNTIGFGFEIGEHQQISIKNYGGTRIAEDEWGMAFQDHIMFNVVKFSISNSELIFMDSQNEPIIIFIHK